MKIRKTALFLIVLTLIGLNSYAAANNVKVGLYFGSTSLLNAAISSEGKLVSLPAMNLNSSIVAVYKDNNSIAIYDETQQNMLGQGESGEIITITSENNIINIEEKRYRGSLLLKPADEGITIINDVGLEEYLFGVVPKEAVSSWPAEALKAQAVAARSLVFSSLKGKHSKQGFDLCATTNCQVYGGYDAEVAATNDAVNETAGMVAVYNGKAAETLYSASNGGYTESSANVWGGDIAYLKSFEDIYDEADKVKGMVWSVNVTAKEIENGAAKYGGNIGNLTGIKIIETAPSGRVIKLEVTGTDGSFILDKDKTRSFLNLKSQMYTITSPGGGLFALDEGGIRQISLPAVAVTDEGAGSVAESPKILTAEGAAQYTSGGDYVFSGRGYGHGVGMSQWGAKTMAEKGFTYKEIIEYYFPSVKVDSLESIAQ